MTLRKSILESVGTDQTDFQQFVVRRISALISGQDRIEHMISRLLHQDYPVGPDHRGEIPVISGPGENLHKSPREPEFVKHAADVEDTNEATPKEYEGIISTMGHQASQSFQWPATLRSDWPKSLRLRHVEQADDVACERSVAHSTTRSMSVAMAIDAILCPSPSRRKRWDSEILMLTPTHPVRMIFDLLSIVCLFFDLMTIPVFIAWDVEADGFLKIIQTSVMIFWTLDIVASFRTGYVSDGVMVKDFKKVATRYLKGSFILEFAIVGVDWFSFVYDVSAAQGTAKVLRMGKFTRILRLAGLSRASKFTKVFHNLASRNSSQGQMLALEMFKLLITIIYINHLIGCTWFAISQYGYSDTGARWTDLTIGAGTGPYEDTTPFFQYSTAVHWSLTQMTPGSMQINAQNSIERVFNIFCLVFGVLFFSSLISTLSAKTVQMQMMNQTRVAKISSMIDFLRQRNVDPSLTYLIKQQVTQRMDTKKPLLQQNVEALGLLSDRLQAELHLIVCKPILANHPIFVVMLRSEAGLFTQMCFQAVSFMVMIRDDLFFSAGSDCNHSYVISQGSLTYTQEPATALIGDTYIREVRTGTWLCEAALWAEWIHVGTAECAGIVEALRIDAEQLVESTKNVFVFRRILFEFGRAYHNRLISLTRTMLPSDMCEDAIQHLPLLSTLSRDLQTLVSSVSIVILAEGWSWSYRKNHSSLLREEVVMGQTTLFPISDGNVHRSVNVACLKLCRTDGCILLVIGEWKKDEGILEPDIKLPGTKLLNFEGSEVALRRVLERDFESLKDFIRVEQREDKTEIKHSTKYDIDTEYIKFIYHAKIDPAYPLPEMLENSCPLSSARMGRSSRRSLRERVSQFVGGSATLNLPAHSRGPQFYINDRPNKDKLEIYAWVSPELYQQIESEGNQHDVNLFLQGCDLENATNWSDALLRADDCVPSEEVERLAFTNMVTKIHVFA